MSGMRTFPAAVATAILCTSFAACSESDADDVVDRLRGLLAQLQQQRMDEYLADPFNADREWTQFFFESWPDGIPIPGGRPGDSLNEGRDTDWDMYGTWSHQSPGAADEYGERLEDNGWELESQTTETDDASGWETKTSTYQNDSGQKIKVTAINTGVAENFSVTLY